MENYQYYGVLGILGVFLVVDLAKTYFGGKSKKPVAKKTYDAVYMKEAYEQWERFYLPEENKAARAKYADEYFSETGVVPVVAPVVPVSPVADPSPSLAEAIIERLDTWIQSKKPETHKEVKP